MLRLWLHMLALCGVLLVPVMAQQRPLQNDALQVMALPHAVLQVLDTHGKVVRRIKVEVAASREARARGLMFRRHLAADSGMLFMWRTPRRVAMWMKNTFLPLDMVFIGADGRIVRVHEQARPHDLTPIPSKVPVIAVLEVLAGSAGQLGLRPGVQLRLPARSSWQQQGGALSVAPSMDR